MRHCAFTNQATRNSSESPEMGVKLLHILNPKMLMKTNLLPISLYCQLPELFQLLKIYNEDKSKPVLWDASYKKAMVYKLDVPKVRTEKNRIEICFRTCRVATHLPSYVNLFEPLWLQKRTTAFFWQFERSKKNEDKSCTWLFACDCQTCPKSWSLLNVRERSAQKILVSFVKGPPQSGFQFIS